MNNLTKHARMAALIAAPVALAIVSMAPRIHLIISDADVKHDVRRLDV